MTNEDMINTQNANYPQNSNFNSNLIREEQFNEAYPFEYQEHRKKIKTGRVMWKLGIVFGVLSFVSYIQFIALSDYYDSVFSYIFLGFYVIFVILTTIFVNVGIVKHIKGVIRMQSLRRKFVNEHKDQILFFQNNPE